MSYGLYFDDIKIGAIQYREGDFPNLYGSIQFEEDFLSSEQGDICRIREFIRLQARSCELLDIEHEQEVDQEASAIDKKLGQYEDLIVSEDWYLIDDKGDILKILSPIIRSNNEVTWRWLP